MDVSIGRIKRSNSVGLDGSGFEETDFSPKYFLPSKNILDFISRYPGMGSFRKKVLQILNLAIKTMNQEDLYLSSLEKDLIDFSNLIQNYAYLTVFSDRPFRTIAGKNMFSDEFRNYVGESYNSLFSWIKDGQNSNIIKEFETLFVEELREMIKKDGYTFGINIKGEIIPVYLLNEGDNITLVTPRYSLR